MDKDEIRALIREELRAMFPDKPPPGNGLKQAAEDVARLWNLIASASGMKPVRASTLYSGGLKTRFKLAWAHESDLGVWEVAFQRRAGDKHWRGGNERGWTGSMATFLRPEQYSTHLDDARGCAGESLAVDPITRQDYPCPKCGKPKSAAPADLCYECLVAEKERV